jgi:hypothetical protein
MEVIINANNGCLVGSVIMAIVVFLMVELGLMILVNVVMLRVKTKDVLAQFQNVVCAVVKVHLVLLMMIVVIIQNVG